jgi:class 3 adenylate cyclase
MVDLKQLLDHCDEHVKIELALPMPDVDEIVESFNPPSDVPIEARRWKRVPDAVAVVADLKSSTKLGLGKNARSTASIYEAALKPVVDIMADFGAGWVPIQGDCVIGVFWGERAMERAFCAAVTVKTFSEDTLVPRLKTKWSDAPDTGFKIGVATGAVLVKRIGRARSDHQALVWPGKALNYAVKAAQSGDVGEMIVTGSVWDAFENNDYVAWSCGCGASGVPQSTLWGNHTIEKLDHDNAERSGRSLTSSWCKNCGEEFCAAILAGETHRDAVDPYRDTWRADLYKSSVRATHKRLRDNRRNLRRKKTGRL